MHISFVNMYNAKITKSIYFAEQHLRFILINGCRKLQMSSYCKQVAVVAESICCLGHEKEQYMTIFQCNITVNKFLFVLELLL